MRCRHLRAGRMMLWLLAGTVCASAATAVIAAAPPEPARRAQLARWLRDDCGACHGMTLHGGLGTPLTAAALADKPTDSLVQTVLRGRPGTAMPPWSPFLSETEALWLIEQLQAGTPPTVSHAPRSGD